MSREEDDMHIQKILDEIAALEEIHARQIAALRAEIRRVRPKDGLYCPVTGRRVDEPVKES